MNGRVNSRRLLLLAFVLAILVIGFGLAGFWAWHRQHREMMLRLDGLAAAKAGDTGQAIEKLTIYTENHRDDVEAVEQLAFAIDARAPRNVDILLREIVLLRHVMDLAPDHDEARRKLLDLYVRTSQPTDALRGADTLLRRVPNDATALHAKTLALIALNRLADAYVVSSQHVKAHPDDFEAQKMHLDLIASLNHPPAETEEQVKSILAAGPGKPGNLILAGIGCAYLNKADKVIEYARAASAAHPTDRKMIEGLVSLYDAIGRFDLSQETISAATSDPKSDLKLRVQMMLRHWESGHWKQVVDCYRLLSSAEALQSAEATGMTAMALDQLGRVDEAKGLLKQLQSDAAGDPAVSYAMIVSEFIGVKKSDPELLQKSIGRAMVIDGPDPILLDQLANIQANKGDMETALGNWKHASEMAPIWPVPPLHVAGIMVQLARYSEAVDLLNRTIERSPDNTAPITDFIINWFNSPKLLDFQEPPKLLAVIDKLQQVKPGEESTLAMQVGLIARCRGFEQAKARMIEVVTGGSPLSKATLMSLLRVNWQFGLQQEKLVFDRYQSNYGMTSELAFAKSEGIALKKDVAGAKAYFESVMKEQAKTPEAELEWGMVWGRLLAGLEDPSTIEVWLSLIKKFPQQKVIETALATPAMWQDPAVVAQIIEQLRQIAGTDNIEFRWNRARWLVWQKTDKASLNEARKHLMAVLEAQPRQLGAMLMLGRCLREQGDSQGAMRQLQAASKMFPGRRTVELELALAASEQGMIKESHDALQKFLADPGSDPTQLRQAVTLLVADGQNDTANKLLDIAWSVDPAPSDVGLAIVYAQLNRREQVDAICNRLLENPDLLRLTFIADYRARTGRMEEAKAAISGLDKLQVPQWMVLSAKARFAAAHESTEAARDLYESAIKAGPENARNWLSYIRFQVSIGDPGVGDGLARAVKALPDDPTLKDLNANAILLTSAATYPSWRGLGVSMIDSERYRPVAYQALKLLRIPQAPKATEVGRNLDESTVKLQELADLNPQFLPLQNALIERYQSIGQMDLATKLATRTASVFPTEFDEARQAATLLGTTGQWDESLRVAEELKRHSPESAMTADLISARALVATGRYDSALDHTRPYLAEAAKNPDTGFPVLIAHGQILILLDKSQEANDLVLGSLGNRYARRAEWMLISSKLVAKKELAESWLDQESKQVPSDQAAARVKLALAWAVVASRFGQPQDFQRSIELLKGVPESELSFEALCLLAAQTDVVKDRAAAIHYYRMAIAKRPDVAGPYNNLAVILSSADDTADEGLKLARVALSKDPQNPHILDTIALIQVHMGKYNAAISSMESAVAIDPDVKWKLKLVELQIGANRRLEARTLLKKISSDPKSANSQEIQARIDALKQQLDATATTAPAK